MDKGKLLEDTQKWDVAVAARAKAKNLPEHFLFYKFGWLGDLDDRESCIMEVTGAVFREAKAGPRKGQRCIMVKGTDRSVYLSPAEIKALDEARDK